MSFKASATARQCGACDYWGGERKADAARFSAEVESSSAKGTCQHPSRYLLPPVNCLSSCPNFKKWCALR